MGRLNPTPGRGFAARVALFRVDADDRAAIRAEAYDGEIERDGAFTTFRRNDDRVFVVQRIAAATVGGTRYILAVVYTPGLTRDAQAPFAALLSDLGVDLVKSWAIQKHADGTLRVPALDSDGTQVGTAVKAAWPADWRVRLASDAEGDPPTGARHLARVVAS